MIPVLSVYILPELAIDNVEGILLIPHKREVGLAASRYARSVTRTLSIRIEFCQDRLRLGPVGHDVKVWIMHALGGCHIKEMRGMSADNNVEVAFLSITIPG
jgi:hypothetical protein